MNFKDLSTLQIALGASVIVHAALLAVRFVDPESFNRVFSETLAPRFDSRALRFTDPDGLRLEVTNYRAERRQRHDEWEEK